MNARRFLFVAVGLSFGLIIVVLFWPARKQAGGLSVSFSGLTNDASGNQLARFSVHNTFPRRVRFGVGEVEFYQTNGWPNAMRVAAGTWLSVTAGAELAFSVPVPSNDGANWRLPIIYEEDLCLADNVRLRIDLLTWGIVRWRPGSPTPVRHGDGSPRTSFACGPEMSALSNLPVQRTKGRRSEQETNRQPDTAGR